MTAINWKSGVNGNWNTAADWSTGTVPGAADDVMIAASGTYTITINAAESAHSITLNDSGARLAENSGGVLNLGGSLTITAGIFALSTGGVVRGGTISVNGGQFLSLGGTLASTTFLGPLNLTAANAALSLTGTDTFLGAGGTGNGTINDTGNYAQLTVVDSMLLNNSTLNLGNGNGYTDTLNIQASSAIATLTLGSGETLAQSKNATINLDSQNAGNTLLNQGTITAASSGGVFTISGNSVSDQLVNQGLIAVSNTDNLNASGVALFVNSGTLSATGTSTTVTIGSGWSDTGLIAASGGATLSLLGTYASGSTGTVSATGVGTTLTVNGQYAQSGVLSVSNAATLDLTGSFTRANLNAIANNAGSLDIAGTLTDTGNIFNAGTTMNLANGGEIIGGTITNATLLNSSNTSYFSGTLSGLTVDGALNLAGYDSTITLLGANTFTGSSGSGAGTINVTGNYATLSILNTTTLNNATLTIGEQTYYENFINASNGGSVTLTLGSSLVLNVDGPDEINADSLVNNTNITNSVGYDLVFGGGSFVNQGTVAATNGGYIQLDNTSFANSGTISASGTSSEIQVITNWSDTGLITASDGGTVTFGTYTFTGGAGGTATATGVGSYLQLDAGFAQNNTLSVSSGATLALTGTLTTATLSTINNTGGSILVEGLLNNTGTFTNSSTLSLASGASVTGGTVIDANGIGNPTGGTFSNLAFNGTLNLSGNSYSQFTLEGANTFAGASGTGTATINCANYGNTLTILDGSLLNNLTIDDGGNRSQINIASDTGSSSSVTFGSNFQLVQTQPYETLQVDSTNTGNTLTNDGLISASGTSGISDIDGYYAKDAFTNAGSIVVSNGQFLSFDGVNGGASGFLTNLTGTTLNGGYYEVDANSTLNLGNNSPVATLNANLVLSGANSVLEDYNTTTSAYVTLNSSLKTIGTAGALRLLANRSFTTVGTLADNGALQLGGGTYTATTINIASTGSLSGYGTVAAGIADAGRVEASGGILLVSGAVSGAGTLAVDAGARLRLSGTSAATDIVAFNGHGGTLELDNTAGFTSQIANFAAADVINLGTLVASSASISGTLLSITLSTGASLTETFTAPVTAQRLVISADGHSLTDYALAQPSAHTPEPVAFGNHHVGDSVSTTLSISNTAPTGAYSENLDGTLSANTAGLTATGSFTGLGAGATNSTSLVVGLNTATAGAIAATATLALSSDGSGVDGAGTTPLPSQTINVTGAVYNYAAATLANGGTVTLGNIHVGGTASGFATLTNSAPAGGYSEALDASLSGAQGGMTASGSLTGLAAGATDSSSLAFGYTAAASGTFTGSANLALTSDGTGIDGLGTTALPGQTVNVIGAAYAYATPALASTTINLGVVHVGATAQQALALTNGAAANGYSEALDAAFGSLTGAVTATGSVSMLSAGSTDSSDLLLGLSTSNSGTYTGSALLGLTSDGTGVDGLGTTALPGQTITVTGIVDNYAVAAFTDAAGPAITGAGTQFAINLGTLSQGGTADTFSLGALNAATGLSDLLGGTLTTTGGAGFTDTGFGTFSGLSAGQSETAQSVTLSTSAVGTFTETIVLTSAGSNASGYNGALATETLTITGTVSAAGTSTSNTYVLATGPNILTGADGGDLIQATAGSLNSRDQLTGGNGYNVLQLTGGGAFDIGAPKTFANIPTIQAIQGQAAHGTLASTLQTIYLRDGSNETLTVAAGTAAPGNTNPLAITIYGGTGNDSIILAGGQDSVILYTGTDTIALGGVGNSITAGGGTAILSGAITTAAAAIHGNASSNTTLTLSTAGTATLNAADTYLTVNLAAASKLTLGAMAFITVNGGAGKETITAGGANQTLIGGTTDLLTGSATGTDTFLGTSAALSGDTIGKWTTGDVIDLTDMNSATLQALAYASSKLTVKDGTHTSVITFNTTETLSNFTVLGSDGHGGTLIGFHG